jgi:hypothetical protein
MGHGAWSQEISEFGLRISDLKKAKLSACCLLFSDPVSLARTTDGFSQMTKNDGGNPCVGLIRPYIQR